MSLTTGTKLGPYEVVALIGAGGMGEVYKASDARLNRMVAIKVLQTYLSDNPEMKQRFEREAQTVAALNHPNICTLYDIGQQDRTDFLVMEYLEGETLADRLTRGPLPLDEALKVAIAIADALDKAHGQGVTHRDLKPSNVMLAQSGTKLMDFGLAKLRAPQQQAVVTISQSKPDATAPGTILGTMQYMAPEQLEGNEADARTDIFAFGGLVYEMVTGKKAFSGKSHALLISAIMAAEPQPMSKSQPMVPPALDYVVKRCLAKDPEERVQTAWDLMGQLQWIAEGGSQIGIPAPLAASRRRRATLTWAALAVPLLLVTAMAAPTFYYFRGSAEPEPVRFLVSVPDMPSPEAVSVSPDGTWIAFAARNAGSTALFTRPIDAVIAQRLAGTEGVAGGHFWSPDSRTIAFFSGGKLKKVEAAGGAPQIVCDTADMQGGSWNNEGMIVFASSRGLYRVPGAGGDPVALQDGQEGQEGPGPMAPSFLPDGRHFLYQSAGAISVGSLDSTDRTRIISARSNAVYVDPGHVLYHREGTLFAAPFNAKKLTVTGDAIRIGDRVPFNSSGVAAFAASKNGVLVYRTSAEAKTSAGGSSASSIPSQPLLMVDASGAKVEQVGAPGGYAGLNVSPDGKRIAVHRHDPDGGDIWIFERGTMTRFTFNAAQDNSMPVWSPDGKQIAFGSKRGNKWGLYAKLSDNSRDEEALVESDLPAMPMSWSPDGKFLVYWVGDPKTSGDVWAIPVAGAEKDNTKKPTAILQTLADERHPEVSPDGKWLAYSSNESGRSEIYIRPFPEGSGKWQVSLNGGVFPRWRRDGKQLYFMSLVSLGNMMASAIKVSGSSIERGQPSVLFQSGYTNSTHASGYFHAYAVSAGGQRFLIPRPENVVTTGPTVNRTADANAAVADAAADRHAAGAPTSGATAPITVVFNWTTMLTQK